MTQVTNKDFALEVKSDRLKILYKITIAIAAIFLLFSITFGFIAIDGDSAYDITDFTFTILAVIAGSLATRYFLERDNFDAAAWSYALGGVGGVFIVLSQGDGTIVQVSLFILPIIVFFVGLLLSPLHTFYMAVISAITILVAPQIGSDISLTDISTFQTFAIVLSFASAGLAAQVTGELYKITEWALSNYQRERRTNDELFEKRQALQMSLKRSEVLGDKLRETNKDLEVAHAAAEEAKHFRGQFLANMSHELRTPLNAIIGFSETMLKFPMMYDDETLPETYKSDLDQIYNSGRQLLFVINDILDLAKVDAGKLEVHMQKVEIGPIVNAVMSTAKGLVGSKLIKLTSEKPDPLPKCLGR